MKDLFSLYYRLVIETLKEVDGERKCCRLVGGILVERTVQEVLPALEHNKEQVWIQISKICFYLPNEFNCNAFSFFIAIFFFLNFGGLKKQNKKYVNFDLPLEMW